MKTHRLLVLDDDPAILDMLHQSLSEEGYHVTTARHGVEGLRRVQNEQFDLILLDLMMPVMNGEQFLGALRRLPDTPQPPVIIISADRNVSGKIRSLNVAGGLPKPFSLDDLLTQVALHLDSLPSNGTREYHAPGP